MSPAMVSAVGLPVRHVLGEVRVVVLAQVEDRDVRAFAGEQGRDRPADPAVAAGDQRDLVPSAGPEPG
jgi:hypothetical protein